MNNANKSHLLLFLFLTFLFIISVSAVTQLNSPTTCSGLWTDCSNAFADNTNVATASVSTGVNKSGTWQNYGFSIENSSTITNVTVRADFFASKSNGFINVRVSGDGGNTFGPSHIVGGNTVEKTFLINVANDFAWTPGMLSNASLRVNATCFKSGGAGNPTCKLDWIPVQVMFTPFDFTVNSNPNSTTILQGGSANTNVTVTLVGGNSQNVTLSQTGCPSLSTCTFSPSSGNPTYTSLFTIATDPTTPVGTYSINITGTGGGKSRNTIYTLTINSNCTRSNPAVLITPFDQNGTAGSTLTYTTSVTNNDTPSCGASTFNLTSNIPLGWGGSFADSVLSISPGSFNTTNFLLTSSINATPGNYNFSNIAQNNNAPGFFGSNSSFYTVI